LRRPLFRRALFSIIAATLLFPSFDGFAGNDNDDEIKKIELSWESKLRFGKAASDINAPGNVIIDAVSNSRTVTGAAFNFGGHWSRGKFKIEAEKNAYVIVSLPPSIVLESDHGGYTITVNNLHMNLTNPVKLSKSGRKTIYIGGTLQITPNHKADEYRDIGTLVVNVEYN